MARRRKTPPVTLATVRALSEIPTQTLSRDTDPTPERLMQAGYPVAMQLGTGHVQIIGPKRLGPMGGDGIVRIAQAPLDRLHARGQLDPVDGRHNGELFEAGQKLRNHHYLAGLSGFAANDLNRTGPSDPATRTPITETMESNRRALRAAEWAMDPDAWQVVRAIVILEQGLEEAGSAAGFGNRMASTAVALDRLRWSRLLGQFGG